MSRPIDRTAASPRRGARHLALAGLSIALLCVSAWIAIPLGPVPVTLQVLVVLLVALLLEPADAAAAFAGYLLLGAIGAPVFSAMQGGVGVLLGPTGGYLIGFAVGGVCAAMARGVLARRVPAAVADAIACSIALAVIYTLGTVQLALVAGLTAEKAVAAGVAPFVLLDVAKGVGAVALAAAVRRALGSSRQATPAA